MWLAREAKQALSANLQPRDRSQDGLQKAAQRCSSTPKNADNYPEPEGFFVSIAPPATSRRIYQCAHPEISVPARLYFDRYLSRTDESPCQDEPTCYSQPRERQAAFLVKCSGLRHSRFERILCLPNGSLLGARRSQKVCLSFLRPADSTLSIPCP